MVLKSVAEYNFKIIGFKIIRKYEKVYEMRNVLRKRTAATENSNENIGLEMRMQNFAKSWR